MRKEHKTKLLARLEIALQNLYHNATPNHPSIGGDAGLWQKYDDWFNMLASDEIYYLRSNKEKDYKRATKSGKGGNRKTGIWIFESESHKKHFYLSRINDYGNLYTWGRGGRTLAPDNLIRQHGGGSFTIRGADDFAEYNNEYIVDMILTLEAFDSYVAEWCSKENILDCWHSEAQLRKELLFDDASQVLKETKELAESIRLLRNTPAKVCNVLIAKIRDLRKSHSAIMREFAEYHASINFH